MLWQFSLVMLTSHSIEAHGQEVGLSKRRLGVKRCSWWPEEPGCIELSHCHLLLITEKAIAVTSWRNRTTRDCWEITWFYPLWIVCTFTQVMPQPCLEVNDINDKLGINPEKSQSYSAIAFFWTKIITENHQILFAVLFIHWHFQVWAQLLIHKLESIATFIFYP